MHNLIQLEHIKQRKEQLKEQLTVNSNEKYEKLININYLKLCEYNILYKNVQK